MELKGNSGRGSGSIKNVGSRILGLFNVGVIANIWMELDGVNLKQGR